MSKLLVIALLLLPLINHGIYLATAWDDRDFFKYCPPSQCSQHGPEIRFRFCLESSNKSSSSSCGCAGRSIRKLACSGQDTILVHPVLGPYNVSAIDYMRSSMKIKPLVDPCLLLQQKLVISRSSSSPQADVINYEMPGLSLWNSSLVRCLREFTPGAADRIAGPVSCLSNTTHFLYLVNGYEDMSILPLDCKVVPLSDGVGGGLIPMYSLRPILVVAQTDVSNTKICLNTSISAITNMGRREYMFDDPMSDKLPVSFKESAERMLSFAETTVYWFYGYSYWAECERSGGGTLRVQLTKG